MADAAATNVSGLTANERELQAASEGFLIELALIEGLERRKRDMPPGHPDRLSLAREIEDRTMGLVGLSRYQSRLIEIDDQALGLGRRAPRKPNVILGEWRAAERVLRDARSVMEKASDAASRLRDEHGRSVTHFRNEVDGQP